MAEQLLRIEKGKAIGCGFNSRPGLSELEVETHVVDLYRLRTFPTLILLLDETK